MAAEAHSAAATKLQALQRGRLARRTVLLLNLAARVESAYRSRREQVDGNSSSQSGGAVGAVRLEGKLAKLSGFGYQYQQRSVHVSNLHFRYSSRHSERFKSVDLADRCELTIISPDRFEFALLVRGGAKEIKLRAASRQDFERWTSGLKQYLDMAQAYYSL